MRFFDRLFKKGEHTERKTEDEENVFLGEMQRALKRVISGLKKEASSEEYQPALLTLRTLLDGSKGSFTAEAALRLLVQAYESRVLQDEHREFDDTFIVVTAIPPTSRSDLRFAFPGGYTKYLGQFDLGRLERGQAFANWVVCYYTGESSIHLQYFSAIGRGKALVVFAQDLLEPHERIKWLGADPWIH